MVLIAVILFYGKVSYFKRLSRCPDKCSLNAEIKCAVFKKKMYPVIQELNKKKKISNKLITDKYYL